MGLDRCLMTYSIIHFVMAVRYPIVERTVCFVPQSPREGAFIFLWPSQCGHSHWDPQQWTCWEPLLLLRILSLKCSFSFDALYHIPLLHFCLLKKRIIKNCKLKNYEKCCTPVVNTIS